MSFVVVDLLYLNFHSRFYNANTDHRYFIHITICIKVNPPTTHDPRTVHITSVVSEATICLLSMLKPLEKGKFHPYSSDFYATISYMKQKHLLLFKIKYICYDTEIYTTELK